MTAITGAVLDHVAIVVDDPLAQRALFSYLGFEGENIYSPDPKSIGDGETSMQTCVVHSGGAPLCKGPPAQLALMEGIDGATKEGKRILSQVSAYRRRKGNLAVEHIALRVWDLPKVVRHWRELGVCFMSQEGGGSPIMIEESDKETIMQAFTYPIARGGLFLELKQVLSGKVSVTLSSKREFSDANVRKLWMSVNELLKRKLLFRINIFGECMPLRRSLARRGVIVPEKSTP